MRVRIGTVLATCPLIHMADSKVSNPEKWFQVDKRIRVRVLSVNKKGRINVTLKKTLIQSEYPIISSYEVQQQAIAHGVISHIEKDGCVVTFFQNVKVSQFFYRDLR